MTREHLLAVKCAVLIAVVFVIGCTGADEAGEQPEAGRELFEGGASPPATGLEAEPAPDAAPDPVAAPTPEPDNTEPYGTATLGAEAGDAQIRRAFDQVRLAFLNGAMDAGVTALVDMASQQSSSHELAICLFGTASYLEFDREDRVSDWRWEYLRSGEGWEVFARTSADDAWRPYLVDHTVTIFWAIEGRSGDDISSGTAHVAVTDDDEVVWYPSCRE